MSAKLLRVRELSTERVEVNSPTVVGPTRDRVRGALDSIRDARTIGREDAETLLFARDGQLDELLDAAGRLRDAGLNHAGRPGVITYSRKVFIPLTHLCQDRCHYCIFVQTPGKLAKAGKAPFLSPDEVLHIARDGAALGCKEALFTLGDRPENRWPIARQWLNENGYDSTIEYMRAMAKRVLEETGLLPHLNPGVMSWSELQRLRPVGPSMGMMLETTSTRLWSEKGYAHYGSPDKDPAIRLAVLDNAGRSAIPFTTGVLLGIGENAAERVDAMYAIRDSAAAYGHIQETIVQNFRAKNGTAMMHEPDMETQEYAAAVAVTRLVLGPDARVQVPPNLTDPHELSLLVRAGIDDWGGVSPLTPDYVNPERPWPQIDELARLTAMSGYQLRERLTTHPHYNRDAQRWIDPSVQPHVAALADANGLANESAQPVGLPVVEWSARRGKDSVGRMSVAPTSSVSRLLRKAKSDPSGLDDAEYAALLEVDGEDLEALAALADRLRYDHVGNRLTYVVNRNIDTSRLGAGDDALTLENVGDLAAEAMSLGATEICVQGAPPSHMPATAYAEVARAIKERAPLLHLHAYRPAELIDGAARAGVPLDVHLAIVHEAGVDTVPGTGARILDDRIRHVLSGGHELPVAEWIRVIIAAHHAGLRSTSTMVYGHLENPSDQVAHLRQLAAVQDQTHGFTEFIPMPFVPADSAVGVPSGARHGPDLRESRAVIAVSRLLLTGRIDHIQAAWPKLGLYGAALMLRSGADDLGGVLLKGTLDVRAGQESGRELPVADMRRMADRLGRSLEQRTTTYGAL